MPWLKFQLANWGSALVWAAALLSPGTFAGKWLSEHGGRWLLEHGGQKLLDLIS
jgi:membrane protein DedA with SNARE-associated domain